MMSFLRLSVLLLVLFATGGNGADHTDWDSSCYKVKPACKGPKSSSHIESIDAKALVICKPGYGILPNVTNPVSCDSHNPSQCHSNLPSCVVDCGELDPPDNTSVSFDHTLVGGTAQYVDNCHAGYELIGDVERTCQPDGKWSGDEPACQKLCGCNCEPTTTDPCLSSMSFTGQIGSYLEYNRNDWNPFLQIAVRYCYQISFEFRTTASYGIMFYSSSSSISGDYIAVHINNGTIVLLDDDTSPVETLQTNSLYNDGQWHQVVVSKQRSQILMTVDTEMIIEPTSSSAESATTNNRYYIGGRKDSSNPPNVVQRLGHGLGLDGCIRNLRLNTLCLGLPLTSGSVQFCQGC